MLFLYRSALQYSIWKILKLYFFFLLLPWLVAVPVLSEIAHILEFIFCPMKAEVSILFLKLTVYQLIFFLINSIIDKMLIIEQLEAFADVKMLK